MRSFAMVLICLASTRSIANAQGDPAAAPPLPAPVAAPPPAPASPAEPRDGMRMRHGISVTIGEEYGSGPSSGLSGSLAGVDWRIGEQINNDYAVYVETHL